MIPNEVDSMSAAFEENRQSMGQVVATMQQHIDQIQLGKIKDRENYPLFISLGGGEEARKRHAGRNKLLPRDRINKLLDVGY